MSEKIEDIISRLDSKAELKQLIYENTVDAFAHLRECAEDVKNEIAPRVLESSPHVEISLTRHGDFEFHLKFSGDTIVFILHTNVFAFPPAHRINKSDYLKKDPKRGYFGMIQIYNFLSDSLKYNRMNDVGFLLARLYVNIEDHFYTEGKRQLGFLFGDVAQQKLDSPSLHKIIEQCMLYSLDFDLYVPPVDNLKMITVEQKSVFNNPRGMSTSKRLGFRAD